MDKIKVYMVAFIIVLILISAFFLTFSMLSGDKAPAGMTKVENYKQPGGVTCDALSPECGVCYGQVINGSCYVVEDELTPSQKQIMGL